MWQPDEAVNSEIDMLMRVYRASAEDNLRPLVEKHCLSLCRENDGAEYRKLIELSAKMQMVGHACTAMSGLDFDLRRQRISSLFGACCFLGDSFLDDYGQAASREYIQRFDWFLRTGWFDIRNGKEQAFYIALSRLFSERDVYRPMLRQALCSLFQVQKLDVELSVNSRRLKRLSRARKLCLLRNCGRDRSGHAITVLALFLVPEYSLAQHHLLYRTGSLISYIDDFGDFYFDLAEHKMTYINQIKRPERFLARQYRETLALLDQRLGHCRGRDLMAGFLHRYFTTRLRKHQQERARQDAWRPVYE